MKAIFDNVTIAESDNPIYIEGNYYFPPESIVSSHFFANDHHTTCFWKGEASYYDIKVNDDCIESAAWYYPNPPQSAIDQVKKDFSNYVAFYPNQVQIVK